MAVCSRSTSSAFSPCVDSPFSRSIALSSATFSLATLILLDAPALPLKNYSTFIACTAVWSICTDGPMVEAMYMLFQ